MFSSTSFSINMKNLPEILAAISPFNHDHNRETLQYVKLVSASENDC